MYAFKYTYTCRLYMCTITRIRYKSRSGTQTCTIIYVNENTSTKYLSMCYGTRIQKDLVFVYVLLNMSTNLTYLYMCYDTRLQKPMITYMCHEIRIQKPMITYMCHEIRIQTYDNIYVSRNTYTNTL